MISKGLGCLVRGCATLCTLRPRWVTEIYMLRRLQMPSSTSYTSLPESYSYLAQPDHETTLSPAPIPILIS